MSLIDAVEREAGPTTRLLISRLQAENNSLKGQLRELISNNQPTANVTGAATAIEGASFVTLIAETVLDGERVLTAGTGISITDAGPNSTVTIAAAVVYYQQSSEPTVPSGPGFWEDTTSNPSRVNVAATRHDGVREWIQFAEGQLP